MASHYKPYNEHYKKKQLMHNLKPDSTTNTQVNTQVNNQINNPEKSVLIIVDIQNDFLPDGALPVMAHKNDKGYRDCDLMINSINELILSDVFDYYVFTQDVHSPGHVSFASTYENKVPFNVVTLPNGSKQVLWPDHCKINDNGSAFSDKLVLPLNTECKQSSTNTNNTIYACKDKDVGSVNNANKDSDDIEGNQNNKDTILKTNLLNKTYILRKGFNKDIDSYSAFKDASLNETGLRNFCTERKIKNIYVCGVARDFCCWWTAADASTYEYTDPNGLTKKQFNVYFILDATLPVPGSINLPDYDPKGNAPHQLVIKQLTRESVHKDLEKNHIDGNMWTRAFLDPYGIKTVSWSSAINNLQKIKQLNNKQTGGSIFVKNKKDVNRSKPEDNMQIGPLENSVDFEFLRKIAKY